MGKDKFENEDLLKYAFQDDIWFHVDELSSAHVYLRMRPEWTIDSIPKDLLSDCCQLVKHNSIEGNKLNHIKIVYTHLSNIKKEAGFDVGQVAFKDGKKRKFTTVERKVNEIINRLNKTKKEYDIDYLKKEKDDRFKFEKEAKKVEMERIRTAESAERKRIEEENRLKKYLDVMKTDKMASNKHKEDLDIKKYEEDFFG